MVTGAVPGILVSVSLIQVEEYALFHHQLMLWIHAVITMMIVMNKIIALC
jgi:hypothetical protein